MLPLELHVLLCPICQGARNCSAGRGLGSQAPKEKCDLLFKVGWRSVEGVTEDDHDRAVADPNFVSLFHSVRSDI